MDDAFHEDVYITVFHVPGKRLTEAGIESELVDDGAGGNALVGEVVNSKQRFVTGADERVLLFKKQGNESYVPVMEVDDLGLPSGDVFT